MSQKPIDFVKDYILIDFIEQRFDINNSNQNDSYRLKDHEYMSKFGMDVKLMHNKEAELIKIGIYIGVEFFDNQKRPLHIQGEFVYEVVFKMPDYAFKLPTIGTAGKYTKEELQLLLRLTHLAVGTLRGYLLHKLQDTALDGYLLPLITDETLIDIIQSRM